MAPDLSFIIPARNEARNIERTLQSIHGNLRASSIRYEVFVVDHGSDDRTRELAVGAGATVIDGASARTVGQLRNRGATRAGGEVLVFLDADVSLANDWGERLPAALERLRPPARRITGSEVASPTATSWIQRVWFGVQGKDRSHINTGHLIVPRVLFESLSGFDERLASGEDYEFSQRARQRGATVEPDDRLVAYHHGYPTGIKQFFLREVWHGMGDARWGRDRAISKVGLASRLLLLATGAAVAGFVITRQGWLLALPLALLFAVSLAATLLRRKRRASDTLLILPLYVVYFVARCSSVFVPPFRRTASRSTRASSS